MFRKMRRFKQQVSETECIEILKSTKRGVLSLIGDDGYPYGVPIDHWYCEEDGKIYFQRCTFGGILGASLLVDNVRYKE